MNFEDFPFPVEEHELSGCAEGFFEGYGFQMIESKGSEPQKKTFYSVRTENDLRINGCLSGRYFDELSVCIQPVRLVNVPIDLYFYTVTASGKSIENMVWFGNSTGELEEDLVEAYKLLTE